MFRNDDGQLCPTEYKIKPNMKHPTELTWSIKFHIIVKIEERTIDSSMFGSRPIRNGFELNSALNQYPINKIEWPLFNNYMELRII